MTEKEIKIWTDEELARNKELQNALDAYHANPLAGSGGGKGGGGGSAPEAPNTLSSRAILKVGILASEGPVEGLPGGAQAIYINDTPLQNPDGTFNFQNTIYDWRVGTPGQAQVPGFNEGASIVDVNAVLTTISPVVRESSNAEVAAMKVIITLPTGLVYSWNGVLYETWAHIQIERRLSGTTAWELVRSEIIQGKTDSPTQKEFRFDRPAGVGKWQYRVTRITADSIQSTLRNATAVASHVEYVPISNNYPDCAYLAIGVDAEAVGGQIPSIAVMWKGLRIKVPSNYNTALRAYSGAFWDGTWKYDWTDDPAWILYDLLTNDRYGMGAAGITEAMIDKFSFYDASVYNNGTVPSSESPYGVEPRFRFSYPMSAREDAWVHLTAVAGAMHCTIMQSRGQIRLSQDRPTNPYMLITKANVISEDGEAPFVYKGSALDERPTSFNVTFQDRKDRFLPRITTVEDQALINKYGLNIADIAAFGCTTEEQAIRHGKHALYTAHHQTDIVQFKMGDNGADLEPGFVVSIWDEDYTDEAGGGRIVSSTGDTITLDRPVAIGIGASIQVLSADGKTIVTRPITSAAGTYTTIQTGGLPLGALMDHADYIVTSSISPRQFRITSVIQEEGVFNIEGIFHDPNKYAFIEQGISLPSPIYSDTEPSICSVPNNLTAREFIVNDNNQITRQALVSWSPPSTGKAMNYSVSYRKTNDLTGAVIGETFTTITTNQTSYTIPLVTPGRYEIGVRAISIFGIVGPSAPFFLNIDTTGAQGSQLLAVTELKEASTGSTTTFLGRDLNVSWRNPLGNRDVPGTVVRDFQVSIIEPSSGNVIRVEYVPGVPVGSVQGYTYSYTANLADAAGPHRSIKISVRCRDTSNNLSSATERTFTNPAPAAVAGFDVSSGIGEIYVKHTRPTDSDYVGVLIWRDTTAGFTPSAAKLVFQGDSTFFTDGTGAVGTTYYYKIAAYDDFGFLANGFDLNVSASLAGTALKYPGVAGGTAFPSTPTEGDSFYRTDLKTLYRYVGGAWVAEGIATGATLPATALEGDSFILSTNNALYLRRSGAWVPITPADGTVLANMIGANQITTGKLAAGAVTANELAASSVIAGKLAANSVDTASLNAGVVTGDKVATRTLTAGNIATGALTANEIGAGQITTVTLAAGAVKADKISVGVLSAISANMGYINAGNIDLITDQGSGWGYIRNYGKWYRDGAAGFVFARNGTTGQSLLSIDCGPSHMWAHSDGDFGLQGPGFLLTNGGLTIDQLNVIGAGQVAPSAAITMGGNYRDGRQLATGWNTYAECAVYSPYGGAVAVNMSATVQAGAAATSGESNDTFTTYPVLSRILINGGLHIQFEDIAQNGRIGCATNWSAGYLFGVNPGSYTCTLQFYFDGNGYGWTGWNGSKAVGVYKANILAQAAR